MNKFIKVTIAKNKEVQYVNKDHIVYIKELNEPITERKGMLKLDKEEVDGTIIKTTAHLYNEVTVVEEKVSELLEMMK